jgi:hypothetical protein
MDTIKPIMTPKPLVFLALVAFAACGIAFPSCGQKEDLTSTVDHSGSIETSVTVEHADSTHDVVLTTHKVWTNGNVYSTIVHRDTVPGLGLISTEGEDSSGNTRTVAVQKDYQIFITMK